MNRELARRECTALVAGLDVPDPFDLTEFCRRIGQLVGHDIVLMPHPMAIGGLYGMWLRTAKADYIFYEQDTSQLHQLHIIFHEVGHILRSARGDIKLGKNLAGTFATGMKLGDVFRMLRRDSFTDDDEFEAELIATLLLARIGRHPARAEPRAIDPAADSTITRIAGSLQRGET